MVLLLCCLWKFLKQVALRTAGLWLNTYLRHGEKWNGSWKSSWAAVGLMFDLGS